MRGKLVSRGKGNRADYILYHKPNIPIAMIEAKDNTHAIDDGMQQGLGIVKLTHHKLRHPQDIGSKITPEYSIWWLGPSATG